MTFGQIIQARRNELKLCQSDCARSLGVTTATINNYEQDLMIPEKANAAKLRYILGFSIEEYYSALEQSALCLPVDKKDRG
jgi:transcriptional regulator with XRE-family HTH domain